ncbi:2,3-diaminopropionate biosynthesis protein SbnA [Cohnella lubricantis]|uniref:N-(2-amino-2-carboxyethyl)-L-glutamate synthase n=1 Tax=Cohnella lubricantis TaxID=2163172 RepID=A0A841TJT2_9BACL|nr:2,3-diaminopropionate biosynthesis protein SbnA [Cohnella lubricantis]MBB6679460.1 2,3-diaminopropionate biosynthesis protein SbnA [Cohnella lubricantis]MBP2118197.1 cysteine synthase A [Cohnella lubricantis]
MELRKGVLQLIGRTPLVPLDRMFAGAHYRVFAKLEMMNPGGSAKDRPALRMIDKAIERGEIGPGTTIVESSSGNLAISLALICRCLGLPFICVLDARTTPVHLRLLRSYGARIEWIREPDRDTGEYLPARLRRVRELLADIPGSYWPNQYANPDNYLAHYETTMPELLQELGRIDYLFCGISTFGTLRGCAERIRAEGLPTKVVAVDAAASVIFGAVPGAVRRLPGLGAAIVPPLSRPELADRVARVGDVDCVRGCRELLNAEAIMAGASSGAVLSAIRLMQVDIEPGAVCAAILVDRGERYGDTVYDDEWVAGLPGGRELLAETQEELR